MKKFLEEFKAFISRGSVIDLAVGVIIGGAFQKIISSLVKDIFMPFISLAVGKNLEAWVTVLKAVEADVQDGTVGTAVTNSLGVTTWYSTYITINWGTFVQTVIDFILIALMIFIIIKALNAASKRAEELKKKVEAKLPIGKKEEAKKEEPKKEETKVEPKK
ncbi:MAG: large conductance mechanosensitive channel protein MscL [Firmicutes bacterium]|nr:large conductance mechanosensitive channel protein MscL [Bacillota bacterium]